MIFLDQQEPLNNSLYVKMCVCVWHLSESAYMETHEWHGAFSKKASQKADLSYLSPDIWTEVKKLWMLYQSVECQGG